MIIIGIDPGSNGGMACFQPDSNGPAVFKFDGATERDICNQLAEWASGDAFAYLERVGVMPGEGVSGAFSFGQSYGFLRGILVASAVPFEDVTSGKWCAAFQLKRGKDETKTAWKNRHKAKAQQLWPSIKITHAYADALLIAEYGRRLRFLSVPVPDGAF